MTKSGFIEFDFSVFHYCLIGEGNFPIVAFGGYGEDCSKMELLNPHFGDEHLIIAIDLPFHGKTVWDFSDNFYVEVLHEVIQKIFKKEAIISDSFILLGYSLGCRICLSLIAQYPTEISKVILLAPDGMRFSIWRFFATSNWFGRAVFRYTMLQPNRLMAIAQFLYQLKVIPPTLHQFIKYHLAEKEDRWLLYQRWVTLRHFEPSRGCIKKVLTTKSDCFFVFIGKQDSVILESEVLKYNQSVNNKMHIISLDAGHNLMKPRIIAEIAQYLYV